MTDSRSSISTLMHTGKLLLAALSLTGLAQGSAKAEASPEILYVASCTQGVHSHDIEIA